MGPDGGFDRTQYVASTSTGPVERLRDNRDIPKLTVPRRIHGLGIVVAPPETNSSVSTVGRSAPTFSIEGSTYRFKFIHEKLAVEAIDDDKGSNSEKEGCYGG